MRNKLNAAYQDFRLVKCGPKRENFEHSHGLHRSYCCITTSIRLIN